MNRLNLLQPGLPGIKKGFSDIIAYLEQSRKIRDDQELKRLEKERKEAQQIQLEAEQKKQEKRRRLRNQIITSLVVGVAIITFLVFYSVSSRRKEIAALKAKEEATIAEQRTKELLQLVVSGRGEEYKNKDYREVVDRLTHEQNYPLDSLIVPRAIQVPISGTNLCDFLIWIDVPTFRRNEIKEVSYRWPCKGFIDSIHIGKEPSLGFAFGYRGRGTCPEILINVIFTSGKEIKINYPIRNYLRNNFL